ncbi:MULTISPECIES: HNH endonuclease [Enterococcus]|nr:HNH endonuclease [Enterococcus faecalis]MBB6642803.1 HNH endonuclease [Enterococcus faecalis]MCV3125567.1 HNH endonuclease [Enterococcus faecalis]MDH5036761.1 HNH endonuclease [Enterococcus faecalis]MDK4367524.1 HNH endonuclease [Enterococcus faecalis]MDK4374757.1 HNH endonuclease [Enterococcus faecalis]
MTGSSEHLTNRTKVIHELKCNECSNTFGSTNKEQRFCSYKCKTRNRNKLNELERRKYYAEGDKAITLSKLIDKENNICYICLGECDSNDYIEDDNGTIICGNKYPSVEHVIPLSKGGKHEWDNVKLAHRGCNIKKSNKVQKNLARGFFTPPVKKF